MIKTQLTEKQYLAVRSLIAHDFGFDEWSRSSKRRKIKIVKRALQAFYASPQWARVLAQYPPADDGYWRPLLTEEDDEQMTAELAELVVKMSQAEGPYEKLDLMQKLHKLLRRMNGKDPDGDD